MRRRDFLEIRVLYQQLHVFMKSNTMEAVMDKQIGLYTVRVNDLLSYERTLFITGWQESNNISS